jgi:hypothetical protein
MNEFSAQWLGLREPVDHRSRNQDLQAQVIDYLTQMKTVYPGIVRLTDLGSGTGSNLRALAPQLSSMQHWTLIDYDIALLHTARATLLAWADSEINTSILGITVDPSTQIKPLSIIKQNKTIIIEFCDDRLNFLKSLKTFPVFGKGWENRVNSVKAEALKMLG